MLMVCMFLWWRYADQRKPIMLSAALSAPFGLLSIFFVPHYWDPVRVVVVGAGIEDLMFSFAGGGIVWFGATFFFRSRIKMRFHTMRIALVYLGTTFIGISLGMIFNLAGLSPMAITYLSFSVVVIVFLRMRKQLWLLSLSGALTYGLFYTILCFLIFSFHPDFLQQWNLEALSGVLIVGAPLEELLWAFGFGAVWPLIIGYGFDVRFENHAVLCERGSV